MCCFSAKHVALRRKRKKTTKCLKIITENYIHFYNVGALKQQSAGRHVAPPIFSDSEINYRDVQKVFGHCKFLLYISYKNHNFSKHNINTLQDIVCLYQKMNNTVECDKIIKCKGSHLNLFFNLYYRKYTWIFIIMFICD
jgi:hypothetical protein